MILRLVQECVRFIKEKEYRDIDAPIITPENIEDIE